MVDSVVGVGHHLRWSGSTCLVRYLVAIEQTTCDIPTDQQREKKSDHAGARDDEASGESGWTFAWERGL